MKTARAPGVSASASSSAAGVTPWAMPSSCSYSRRDVGRHAAGEHEAVDDARVRVALDHDGRAERRERQRQRVVALARAVREEPGARGAVRLGGERLGALVGGRRGAEVDAVDVGRHVEHQRALAERGAQPGVGPGAALVAGDVEARRAAERVRPHRVEVRGGRLLGVRDARPRLVGERHFALAIR